MISSESIAIDVFNSFMRVIAFPLFDGENEQDEYALALRSSPRPSGMHLYFVVRDLNRFMMMVEEPTKDDVMGSGIWTFALGNAMLWWHSA